MTEVVFESSEKEDGIHQIKVEVWDENRNKYEVAWMMEKMRPFKIRIKGKMFCIETDENIKQIK